VALQAQLDPESMEPQFYFKLHKYDIYDKKERDKAITFFGKEVVESHEAFLNTL